MAVLVTGDASAAHGFTYAALRYFNVAGADSRGRTGLSTPRATHPIKVACETATGKRPAMDIFGVDYPTTGPVFVITSSRSAISQLCIALPSHVCARAGIISPQIVDMDAEVQFLM